MLVPSIQYQVFLWEQEARPETKKIENSSWPESNSQVRDLKTFPNNPVEAERGGAKGGKSGKVDGDT